MGGSLKDLAYYRYSKACDDLSSAEVMLYSEKYRQALNRSYYAIFHAIRAVNALDGVDFRKHSGAIAHFNKTHVKTGHFPKDTYRLIDKAYKLRENADYDDFYIASKEDAINQVNVAKMFLNITYNYLVNSGVTL